MKKQITADLILEDFRRNSIDRRSALKHLVSIGITAAAAYTLLGESLEPTASAQDRRMRFPDWSADEARRQMQTQIEALTKIASDPEVVKFIKEISEKVHEGERRSLAKRLVEEQITSGKIPEKYGIDPDSIRVTTRVFEVDPTGVRQTLFYEESKGEDNPTQATVCVSLGGGVGITGCVTVGT